MKLKLFFSKWSCMIHRWIGLYFAVIVLLYLAEFFILPVVYSKGLPTVDGTPPIHTMVEGASLSLDQALRRLFSKRHWGSVQWMTLMRLAICPTLGCISLKTAIAISSGIWMPKQVNC